jgi:hypothetical protein
MRGKHRQVKSLLDKGASPVWMNRKSDGSSPPDGNALVLACKQGEVGILGLLIDACYRNHFPINSFGKEMHIATIRYSKWKAFLLLHQRHIPMTGSSVDLPMPIFIAAEGGKHEMLAYLLRTYPVDWREYEFRGHSLLSIASKNGRYECVDLLLYSQYFPQGEVLEFAIECARAYRQAHILCLLTSALPNFVDWTARDSNHRRSSIAMTDPMSDDPEKDDQWSPLGRRNTLNSSYNRLPAHSSSFPAAPPPTRACARSIVFDMEDSRQFFPTPSQEEEICRTSGESHSEYGSCKSFDSSDFGVQEEQATLEGKKPMKNQDPSLQLVPPSTSQASNLSSELELPAPSSTSSEDEQEIHDPELLSGSAFGIDIDIDAPLSSGAILDNSSQGQRDSSASLSPPRSSDCLLKADMNGLLSYLTRSRSGSEDRKRTTSLSSFESNAEYHNSDSSNQNINMNTSNCVPPRSTGRMRRTLSTRSLPAIAECSAWEEEHEMDEDDKSRSIKNCKSYIRVNSVI